MNRAGAIIAASLAVVALADSARAQTTFTFTVTPVGGFTFQPADVAPDLNPVVDSPPLTLVWDVKNKGPAPPWHVVMEASGDLTSGSDTIDISNIYQWTGTGSVSSGGPMGRLVAHQIAGATAKGTFTGTLTFHMYNKWDYKPGNYTTTITFTISSP